jgi:hypothetical protein
MDRERYLHPFKATHEPNRQRVQSQLADLLADVRLSTGLLDFRKGTEAFY